MRPITRLPQRWSISPQSIVSGKHVIRFRANLAGRTFQRAQGDIATARAGSDSVGELSLRNEAVSPSENTPTSKPPPISLREKFAVAPDTPFTVEDRIALRVHGKTVRFNNLFLRDACQCSMCVDEHSGQKKFETASIPANIKAIKATVDESGTLNVQWSNDMIPGHKSSSYSVRWLLNAASPASSHQISTSPHGKVLLWNKSKFTGTEKFFSYEDFLHEDTGLFEAAIKQLGSTGLIFLRDVPEEEGAIEKIAGKVGPLKNTFYGRTWDVKDKPKAENVAYTSHFLGLHMDLLYMKYPPGIQLLHCLQASCEGGESMFADAFHAASVLWQSAPGAFHDLCTFPVTYRYNKGGHYYSDTKPTIELDISQPSNPDTGMPAIRNINWSPPFQGPFTVERGHDDFAHKLSNYHSAAKAFQELINQDSNQFTHRLAPGECVIFNNRRVLHGRQKFQSGTGIRWLKGAYLDMDDFSSTLHRAYNVTESPANSESP